MSEWIPVTKQTPEVGAVVLIYQPGYDHPHCARYVQAPDGTYHYLELVDYYGTFAPSHWMHLPPPPAQEPTQ